MTPRTALTGLTAYVDLLDNPETRSRLGSYIAALRSAVEDQERMDWLAGFIVEDDRLPCLTIHQREGVLRVFGQYDPSKQEPPQLGIGPDLRIAIDAARTPGKEND